MAPALLAMGCFLGFLVSPTLLGILLVYFAMSAAYSLRVKNIVLLDVLFLAGLYTVRIMAGSAATGIWPSHWLLAFSTFLFFSLALVKRYSELVIMRRVDGNEAKARGYELSDGELLAAMGTASGYLAVLVLALYINTGKAQALYARRELLWLLCPLLLYWISYIWLIAHRGKMPGDPVEFATKDRTSRILLGLMLATAAAATVLRR
jgi:4-hydroxybenzoate polyprenyltransferase